MGEGLEVVEWLQSPLRDWFFSFRIEERLLFRQGGSPGNLADNRWGDLDHLQITVGNVTPNHDARSYDRVRLVRLVNDFLEMVVGDDGETIYRDDADSLTIGQS